jgi:hypothetical protein
MSHVPCGHVVVAETRAVLDRPARGCNPPAGGPAGTLPPMPEQVRARRALMSIVLVALWGLLTHGTYAGTGDEPHYLAAAHSIAFDGDLDLSNNYGANEPLVGGGALAPEAHVQPGTGGVPRPVHDVGLPLAFAPYVLMAAPATHAIVRVTPPHLLKRARLTPAVLYRHLLSLAMIGLTMALAAGMFDAFVALGASARAALGTSLLLTLSPPLLIFSILFFTELPSALLCFLAFRHVCLVDTRGAAKWALIGLATGFLFLLHAKNIGLVLPLAALALYALRGRERRPEAAAFTLALVLMLGVRTALNYHFWGTLVSGPHARFEQWPGWLALTREVAVRSAGMLADQEFGLLPYAPIYVLAALGAVALLRSRRSVALPALFIAGVYVALILLPLTNVHGWMGGWNPAARFLTPIVPLLGLFVFAGLRAAPRALAVPLTILQIAISAYAWQHPKILWNDGDGRAAVCEITGSTRCDRLPSFVAR